MPQFGSMAKNGGDPVRVDAADEMRQVESALDRIIAQTDSTDRERQRDLEALRAVARQFVGQSPCAETVTTAMIEAVLAWRLEHVCSADGVLRRLAEEIGADVTDDVHSLSRLESLWKRLSESVR